MEEKRVIKPTVGRMVHYWPNGPAQKEGGGQPEAAVVASVHGDRCVNITAFSPSGHPYGASSVVLRQPDDVITTGAFAEWMDYQVGQAAKTETAIGLLEGKIGEIDRETNDAIGSFDRRLLLVEGMVGTLPTVGLVNQQGQVVPAGDHLTEALDRAEKENPVKSG